MGCTQIEGLKGIVRHSDGFGRIEMIGVLDKWLVLLCWRRPLTAVSTDVLSPTGAILVLHIRIGSILDHHCCHSLLCNPSWFVTVNVFSRTGSSMRLLSCNLETLVKKMFLRNLNLIPIFVTCIRNNDQVIRMKKFCTLFQHIIEPSLGLIHVSL